MNGQNVRIKKACEKTKKEIITKTQCRYEGLLSDIDLCEGKVTLTQMRLFEKSKFDPNHGFENASPARPRGTRRSQQEVQN